MKIFLSWSGLRSRAVAESLNDWLRRVIQAIKPFYSPEIEKGAKWSSEIDDALEGTRFGIICLTPDNLNSAWIHFEAGALSKTQNALIWTFLHGLTPGDVPPPLGKFQHTVAEKDDVLRLLRAINGRIAEVGGEPLQERLLEENFELFWPRLEESLKAAEKIGGLALAEKPQHSIETLRDEREILNEILELVRSQERRLLSIEESFPATTRQASPKPVRKEDFYSAVQIPVPSKIPNAHEIATKFGEGFCLLNEKSTFTVDPSENGFVVQVTFDPPIVNSDARTLIRLIGDEIGYSVKTWSATGSSS